jgi:hypothetical protein
MKTRRRGEGGKQAPCDLEPDAAGGTGDDDGYAAERGGFHGRRGRGGPLGYYRLGATSMDDVDAGRSWKVGRTDPGRLPRRLGRVDPGWLPWTAQTRWRFSFHGRADAVGQRERRRRQRERRCARRSRRLPWTRWRVSFHGRVDPLVGADSERETGRGRGRASPY